MAELNQFEADIYLENFAERSVRPVIPYVWTPDEDAGSGYVIEEVTKASLTEKPLEKGAYVALDPAVWVQVTPQGGVVVLSHEFVKGDEGENLWQTALLTWMPDLKSVNKLIDALQNARDELQNRSSFSLVE